VRSRESGRTSPISAASRAGSRAPARPRQGSGGKESPSRVSPRQGPQSRALRKYSARFRRPLEADAACDCQSSVVYRSFSPGVVNEGLSAIARSVRTGARRARWTRHDASLEWPDPVAARVSTSSSSVIETKRWLQRPRPPFSRSRFAPMTRGQQPDRPFQTRIVSCPSRASGAVRHWRAMAERPSFTTPGEEASIHHRRLAVAGCVRLQRRLKRALYFPQPPGFGGLARRHLSKETSFPPEPCLGRAGARLPARDAAEMGDVGHFLQSARYWSRAREPDGTS